MRNIVYGCPAERSNLEGVWFRCTFTELHDGDCDWQEFRREPVICGMRWRRGRTQHICNLAKGHYPGSDHRWELALRPTRSFTNPFLEATSSFTNPFREAASMSDDPLASAPVETLSQQIAQVRAMITRLETEREAAYHDRDLVLALLARLAAASGWPVGTREDTSPAAEPRFRRVVYVETPAGQLSWHYAAEEAPLFATLPEHTKAWDGHTTPEKHARIAGVILEIDRLNAQLHGQG